MEQYQEQNYAIKTRKLEKNDLKKHKNRDCQREAREASRCNSLFQSGEGKEEVEAKIAMTPLITNDEWIFRTRSTDESLREKDPLETHQEGRQGVPCPDKGRCETQESNHEIKTGEEKVKEKVTAKERKHEAKETKAYEKKEDKREAKKESKGKKK